MIPSLVFLFGIVPSAALFVWIERNMALPWIGTWIGWPWIYFEGGIATAALVNLLLIAAFGFLHSYFAGRLARAPYVIGAGISSLFLMAAWQPTGIILWNLIPSAVASSLVSFVIYWGLLATAAIMMRKVENPVAFVGLAAAKKADRGTRSLWTGGLYGRIRHPIYTLTLLAWVLAPMMSLDRALFIFGMGIYLAIAIPREERRMIAEFGEAYREYQARTPMLIPRLPA